MACVWRTARVRDDFWQFPHKNRSRTSLERLLRLQIVPVDREAARHALSGQEPIGPITVSQYHSNKSISVYFYDCVEFLAWFSIGRRWLHLITLMVTFCGIGWTLTTNLCILFTLLSFSMHNFDNLVEVLCGSVELIFKSLPVLIGCKSHREYSTVEIL